MQVKRRIVEEIPSPWELPCVRIREQHRGRRYAMKLQQKIDRALESYFRVNMYEWNSELPKWSPDLGEKERKAVNREVKRLIKAARKEEDGPPKVIHFVKKTDRSREPADEMRADFEKDMEALATTLPVAEWVRAIPGAGLLGLATIIGETGPLDDYANVAKVWKRLGYAPYNGFAGSSWKRDTWRPRALTKEEWIENPFSGAKYALIYSLAESMFRKQWIGAKEDEDGEIIEAGKPNGYYGEIYWKRRQHTAVTHPDWTKGHSHKDGLRIMIKAYLAELWGEWMKAAREHMPPKDVAA